MSPKKTQNELIYRELAKGRILSPIDVQNICGSMKAATRIGEIARDWRVSIASDYVSPRKGVRHKVYWIPATLLKYRVQCEPRP